LDSQLVDIITKIDNQFELSDSENSETEYSNHIYVDFTEKRVDDEVFSQASALHTKSFNSSDFGIFELSEDEDNDDNKIESNDKDNELRGAVEIKTPERDFFELSDDDESDTTST